METFPSGERKYSKIFRRQINNPAKNKIKKAMSENSSLDQEFVRLAAEAEKEIIKEIRSEASSAKGCFTQYSFQTLAFCTGVLSFILGTLKQFPMSIFAGVPAVILLMIMCRIGIYKYMTANRGYGYQLYFEKFRGFFAQSTDNNNNCCVEEKKAWELIIQTKSWEEVFRAWRIIHPTIFRKLYQSPTNRIEKNPISLFLGFLNPNMYQIWKEEAEKIANYMNKSADERLKSEEYPWFMVKDIAQRKLTVYKKNSGIQIVGYYAGTYLHNMLLMLFILQYLFLLPFIIYLLDNSDKIKIDFRNSLSQENHFANFTLVFSIFWLLFIVCRHIRTFRRKEIIENELFSIHSCAIAWQIVIIAHYRAFEKAKQVCSDGKIDKNSITYSYYFDRFYLEEITNQAQKVADNILILDKWLNSPNK